MRLPVSAFLALLLTAPAFSQTPGLPAGSWHYSLVEADNGKTVGSADASVSAVLGGYQITSHGDLKMGKLTYSFSNNNRLDNQVNIVRDELTGSVNGAPVAFHLVADGTGRQFQISIDAQGKSTTNTLDRHQHLALLPDLDPGAYVAMAHFALEQPPTTWIVVPKENGLLVPAQYNPEADARGTLEGQPVTVHHTSVIVSEQNGITVELYYTGDGRLLEADLPEQNFYVIRNGFRVENRPPYTPPRGVAAPSGGEQPPPGEPPQPQNDEPQN